MSGGVKWGGLALVAALFLAAVAFFKRRSGAATRAAVGVVGPRSGEEDVGALTLNQHLEEDELERLGSLSERYEVAKVGPAGAGIVSTGKGDPGGVSYGSYQLSSSRGTAARFVKWLSANGREYLGGRLQAPPGSEEFSTAWKAIAGEDASAWFQLQHDFIGASHYRPAREDLAEQTGFDVRTRSLALRDALWSTAVQHGAAGAVSIWRRVLAGRERAEDAELLEAVYGERGRKDGAGTLVHFRSASESVRRSVEQRFERELRQALLMYQAERAALA